MSSNSSTGQILGYVVGAVVGYFTLGTGYVAVGAAIGGAIGGAIDPPKGPQLVGPRLSDLSQQGASYGAPIPRIHGSVATFGNIFWIENNALKEVSTTSGGGKGGGGGPETTTYKYYATFALGLCEGPISGVRRIWINGDLIYDAGSDDAGTIIASNTAASGFRVYPGDDTQLPDPRMQAAIGIANCPAYRGLAYITFYDLDLTDYGNTLIGAQIKVEVMSSASPIVERPVIDVPYTQPHDNVAFQARLYYMDIEKAVFYSPQWSNDYPANSSFERFEVYFDGTAIRSAVACPGSNVPPIASLDASTAYLYSPTQVFSGGNFGGASGFIVSADGLYAGLSTTNAAGFATQTIFLSQGGPSTQITIGATGTDHSICTDGEYVYVLGPSGIRQYNKLLQLVASGPGRAGIFPESRLKICEGSLYFIPVFDTNVSVYKFADDLSSSSLFASGLSAPDSSQGDDFLVANRIVMIAGASIVPKSLVIKYFLLEAYTNEAVPLSEIVLAESLRSNLLKAADIDATSLTDSVRGYRIASVGALRSAIEPLQGAWPFDVIQSGYKVKFVRRGALSPVVSIPADHLDGRSYSAKPGIRFSKTREMDTQLPCMVTVTHLDVSREYDIGEQDAERLNTDAINTRTIEMPIVLTPDEAGQIAESLIYMYWLERHDIQINLPPAYGFIEASDIITVSDGTQAHELRVIEVGYAADGIVSITAKLNANSTYQSFAAGVAGLPPAGTITVRGPTACVLLDIPLLIDAYDMPGFAVAMTGYLDGWSGGTLFKSDDGGQVWQATNGISIPAVIGYATNSIGVPATTRLIDTASVLNVVLYRGELSSITEQQMLAGGNYFAYGVDGRWEIIAAKNCVLQPDGSYRLSNLLRGRFGTEWLLHTHQANDTIVRLGINDLQFTAMNINQIGQEKVYRAISAGATLDADSNRPFTYRGVNLECLQPVWINGNRHPTTGDWTLTWVRRTRVGGEWRDFVDAPLGEASEAYEVEIMTSATYLTVKRTITGLTSPTATYSAAQQAADFGANQATLYIKVYQLSANVGRGQPLTTSITR